MAVHNQFRIPAFTGTQDVAMADIKEFAAAPSSKSLSERGIFQIVDSTFQKEILSQFNVDGSGNLRIKVTGEETHFNWAMNAIFISRMVKFFNERDSHIISSGRRIYSKSGNEIFLSRIVKGGLRIFYLNTCEDAKYKIQAGTTCIVYKVLDLALGIFKSIRIANPGFKRNIRDEVSIVSEIHQKGIVQGILQPHDAYFDFPHNGCLEPLVCSISTRFACDLFTWVGDPKIMAEARLRICKKVVFSYREFIVSNNPQIDIKLENILINPETEEIRFIDISRVRYNKHANGIVALNLRDNSHTPCSVHETTALECAKLQTMDEFRQNLIRWAQFSLSCVLYEILTSEQAFDIDSTVYVNHTHPLNSKELRDKYPPAIADFIIHCLSHNPLERPSFEQMCKWASTLP